MKTNLARTLAAVAVLSTLNPQLSTFAQGAAFTYQGRLNDGTAPANGSYDLIFTLHDAPSGGAQIGVAVTLAATGVSNGLFTVALDFGSVFDGGPRWLQIGVHTNGVASDFTPLAPRQPLTATPYAQHAGNVSAGGLSAGTYGSAVTLNNVANQVSGVFSGSGANVTGVNAAALNGLGATSFWQLGGNSGTTPGMNFLGTADNQALELKINGRRALRLEPSIGVPNVIGGSAGNTAGAQIEAATIAGGGLDSYPNRVTASYATVGGGTFNTASNGWATVAGGRDNSAGGGNATVGGGYANVASGYGATIPGGDHCTASGDYSFAVGRSAKANHAGAFVFADGSDSDFASSSSNQFLVRADGGAILSLGGNSLQVQGSTMISKAARDEFEARQLCVTSSFKGGPNSNRGLDLGYFYNSGIEAAGVIQSLDNGIGANLYLNPYGGEIIWGTKPVVNWSAARLSSDQGGILELGNSRLAGASPYIDFHFGVSADQDFNVRLVNDANQQLSVVGNLRVTENVTCKTLTILGGADLAEPFAISQEGLAAGTVVIIDPEHPGRLKASNHPYDQKVAGVVSGAEGIEPAISMVQKDRLEPGRNVALSGRVYVRAEAVTVPIAPGDLLTTSTIEGCAMKATDPVRRQGAILGKAMSSLESGRGTVLVLVTLQ